jgi:hypothetical protein
VTIQTNEINENQERRAQITRIRIDYGTPSDADSLRRRQKLTSWARFFDFLRLKRFKVKIFRFVLADIGAVMGFEGDGRSCLLRVGNDWVVIDESSMESEVELDRLCKSGRGGAFLVGTSSFGVKLNGDLWCNDDITGVGV